MARRRRRPRIGEVARHETVRTGTVRPGSLLRAFELKYPNRNLSERKGPKYGDE